MNPDFNFKATGIGSVPFTDVNGTCQAILGHLRGIPYWPQFVRRSHLEDMTIQFSERLPSLELREEGRSLGVSSDGMETELVTFYEHFLKEDLDYFAISDAYAPGLYLMVESILQAPERYGPYIKGQSVGPVTFAAGITGPDGKPVLHHPDLLEAFTKGLAIKALWQVRTLEKSGKRPIIFLDEPYLSGFGSAFSPVERDVVIDLIQEVIVYVRERSDALVGIHCCGNTDWSMIMEIGPDIINFDAYSYLDNFLLYPKELTGFLKNGGTIAWGIVPTADFTGEESVESLSSRLEEGLRRLYEWGLDPERVAGGSILTPACGMGSMAQDSSDKVLGLLSALSDRWSRTGRPD